jgi:hypothetical protein
MIRPRGDDGTDFGAGEGPVVSVACPFSEIPPSRSGSCGRGGKVRRRNVVLVGGGLRTEGTSHVNERTVMLYS